MEEEILEEVLIDEEANNFEADVEELNELGEVEE